MVLNILTEYYLIMLTGRHEYREQFTLVFNITLQKENQIPWIHPLTKCACYRQWKYLFKDSSLCYPTNSMVWAVYCFHTIFKQSGNKPEKQ